MRISLRRIGAIFEIKSRLMLANKSIIIAPLLSIGFVWFMQYVYPNSQGAKAYLLGLGMFFNIFVGGIEMSAFPLAEEKEKKTLRVLMTSSVNGLEYFIGSMLPALLLLTAVNFLLIPFSKISWNQVPIASFLIITFVCGITSILIGYVIGIFSSNQSQAGLLSTPLFIIFSLAPLLQTVNKSLSKVVSYTFVGVMNDFNNKFILGDFQWDVKVIGVLLSWLVISIVIFLYAYKKNGLDN